MLNVGDTVHWRGRWGIADPQSAVVEHIEVECNGGKRGRRVESVSWGLVTCDNVVVDLDNGHWAYGDQIRKA